MSNLTDRLRHEVVRFIEHGSEGATPERALMMRRARGFGLIALVIMSTVLVTALMSGQAFIAYITVGGMLVYGIAMHWMCLERGRFAFIAANCSIGYLLASIVIGAHHVGGAPPSSTTYPSLLILGTMFVLGVRAAAFWTAASLACLAFLTFTATLPPPVPGALETGPGVLFVSRAVVLAGVFSLAGLGRRFEDKATAQLQYMARHDPMTGLYNRRELDQRVSDALARAARYGRQPALLFLDLDNFKQVNDQFGHAVGDEVLRGVAWAIQEQTRRTDAAGRVGGDEFVVLLEDASEQKSVELYAKRLLERLAATESEHLAPITVRASLGVAVYPTDGQDVDSLTRAADKAMYQAKRSGGGRVVLASDC